MIKPLNQHCAEFAAILGFTDQSLWSVVAEWLHIAASVKRVELDTVQFDLGFGWCSNADEFTMSRETLLGDFVSQLSVFLFVCGSLEAAIEHLDIPRHLDKSKRGKIADTCRHISRHYASRFEIAPYHEEVTAFRAALADCRSYDDIVSRFDAVSDIGIAGIRLYAVYVLRNQFAHGNLAFPFPDEENRPISGHGELVSHATRIVLLSMQMLFAIQYQSSVQTVKFTWDPECDE